MRKMIALVLALTGGVLAAGSAAAANGAAVPTHTVSLAGSQDVPPASPSGKGTFQYQLETSKNMFCYSLTWSGIGTPFAAHVHRGLKGVEGPIVIPLSTKAPIAHSGCVAVKESLLLAISKTPGDYYVNVHTQKYPEGAIRGQL
jgi:hypothetical protein